MTREGSGGLVASISSTLAGREIHVSFVSLYTKIVAKRIGPGDHVHFGHPTKPGRVSVDMGKRDIPVGTLRSILRQAGWEW